MSARHRQQDHRKKADYILALKANQGKLCEDVEVFVDEQKALKYTDTTITTHETVDADHGRTAPSFMMSAGNRNDTTGRA
jgi:hypothetical protein